jgi:hypothetical protein
MLLFQILEDYVHKRKLDHWARFKKPARPNRFTGR